MESYQNFRKGNYVYIEGWSGPCQIEKEPGDETYWILKSVILSNSQYIQAGVDLTATIDELKPIPVYGDDELIKFGFFENNGLWVKNDFYISKNFTSGFVVIKYFEKETELTISLSTNFKICILIKKAKN